MKDLTKVLMILLLGLMGGLCSKMNAQVCCGTFAVRLFTAEQVVVSDDKPILKTSYKVVNLYDRRVDLKEPLEKRDGYFAVGMRPNSKIVITFKMKCKRMTITAKNLPGYNSRSYAIAALQFKKGDYFVDEALLDTWCDDHPEIEKEGMFLGFRLIPTEFVKPIQKGK